MNNQSQYFDNQASNEGVQGNIYGPVHIHPPQPHQPIDPPFMAPTPPEDFVARPNEFDQLLAHLLDRQHSTTVAITASLIGAGGFGKTTLAQILCHNQSVRAAFPDGILWVTLGERPGDLTGRINGLVYKLTREHPNLSDPNIAAAHLAETLSNRKALLVIDDVWDSASLRPFLNGGPRCVRLVTTRTHHTLPSDSRKVNVDAMRQEEAVSLLGYGLADAGSHITTLQTLATRLGEWPLLLKLANGFLRKRVQHNEDFSLALGALGDRLDQRGLTAFDARYPRERSQAVAVTLHVSLDLLRSDEQARYAELAIFPEEIDIPLAVLERLWNKTANYDHLTTEKLCEDLADMSLLLRYDLRVKTIRLHDVVRSYLSHAYKADLSNWHKMLLDAYCPDSGNWADLAPEPYLQDDLAYHYLWDYLAYHLQEAGRQDELVRTVANLSYLEKKMLIRGIPGVETDLQIAEKNVPGRSEFSALRYTIARSSHLLNRVRTIADREEIKTVNLLEITLHSRLLHLQALAHLTSPFAETLPRPYLIPWHPLPDLPHPALRRSILCDDIELAGCAITADERVVVFASQDGRLHIWDIEKGIEINTLRILDGVSQSPIWSFSPDTATIVAVRNDGTLGLWDAQRGILRRQLIGAIEGTVIGCTITPDGTMVAAFSSNKLYIWNIQSNTSPSVYSIAERQIYNCSISLTRKVVVVVQSQQDLRFSIQEVIEQDRLETIFNEKDDLKILRLFSYEDGVLLLSATKDHTIRVTDVFTNRPFCCLVGHTGEVHDFVTNAKGDVEVIVSASEDCTLKVWNKDYSDL